MPLTFLPSAEANQDSYRLNYMVYSVWKVCSLFFFFFLKIELNISTRAEINILKLIVSLRITLQYLGQGIKGGIYSMEHKVGFTLQ